MTAISPEPAADTRTVRIFLSSPGDVATERRMALDVIEELKVQFAGRVSIDPVAWDDPNEDVLIRATQTPQASVDQGLPLPSDCDIVVALLWSRMGTPLPHPEYAKPDGQPYDSGTEWEFEDGVRGWVEQGRPEVLLYRCTREDKVDTRVPEALDRVLQGQKVAAFFGRLGATRRRAWSEYGEPENFRDKLKANLIDLLEQQLIVWKGSPFPGLRAFTTSDAPIFYGRRREIDELLARIARSRFVAVVGASGSGKSSLVGAGALPRLRREAPEWMLPNYQDAIGEWAGLRCSPGEHGPNPFLPLATKLAPLIEGSPNELAAELQHDPRRLTDHVTSALNDGRDDAEALLFIDQFEELFTIVDVGHVPGFVEMLAAAANSSNMRVVLTVRSDYYHRCVELPVLARLIERAQLPLPAPSDEITLYEMITGPAGRAGLKIETGLAERIVKETGTQAGGLPLLAYTLDQLYQEGREDGILTLAALERLGGVSGAIGSRAEKAFEELDPDSQARFTAVFGQLIEVEEQGRVARKRARLRAVADDEPSRRFVDAFTDARLLVTAAVDEATEPVVYVAHEALFTSWQKLRDWVRDVRGDLLTLQRVEAAAKDWSAEKDEDRRDRLLWPHERLDEVYKAKERLGRELDSATAAFIEPEFLRHLPVVCDPGAETHRVRAAVDRLVAIGESSLPGLLSALRADNASVRNVAVSALVRLGEPAVPGLLEAASATEPDVRLAALGALRLLPDDRSVSALEAALKSDDARLRSLAAGALRAIGGSAVVQALTDALADENVDTRWLAVGTLGALGTEAVPGLLSALGDPDPGVRGRARDAVRVIGEAAVPQLLDAVGEADPDIAWTAAEALAIVGRPAVGGLARMVGHREAEVRRLAIETITAIGDVTAALELIVSLDDEDVFVRRAAAEAMLELRSPDAIDALIERLGDDDSIVRNKAAQALAAMRDRAVDALSTRLETTRRDGVRALAAAALGRIGESALPGLLSAARHPEPLVRHHATCALSRIGLPAVAGLVEMLADEGDEAAAAASTSLMDIGQDAIPALAEQARVRDAPTRRRIARVFGGMETREAQPPLVDLLADEDASVRLAATEALGKLGRVAIPPLLDTLQHSSTEELRLAAGRALIEIGGMAVPGLVAVCRGDVPFAAEVAAEALRQIGNLPALLQLEALEVAPT